MEPSECCTITSVAAHTLYEKSRPDILVGPGGILDLKETTYKQLDNRVVRVRGAVFRPMPYTVKLEGVKPVGYRTMFIGGIRDPILISQIDVRLSQLLKLYPGAPNPSSSAENNPEYHRVCSGHDIRMGSCVGQDCLACLRPKWGTFVSSRALCHDLHFFQKVMGALEPESSSVPFELAVMGEVLASTQARANVIASLARIALLHCPYPGQVCARFPSFCDYV